LPNLKELKEAIDQMMEIFLTYLVPKNHFYI